MDFKKMTASLVLASVAGFSGAQPAPATTPAPQPISAEARANAAKYAARPHLAYIKTGNAIIDETSRRGLVALQEKLKDLTMIDVAGVVGIDIEKDDISQFPMVYAPVSENAAPFPQPRRRRSRTTCR